MEEIQPLHDQQHSPVPAAGCRFGLRYLLVVVFVCAMALSVLRLITSDLTVICLAMLVLLTVLSFGQCRIRD
jgi:Flp pilus assembly protein TadB